MAYSDNYTSDAGGMAEPRTMVTDVGIVPTPEPRFQAVRDAIAQEDAIRDYISDLNYRAAADEAIFRYALCASHVIHSLICMAQARVLMGQDDGGVLKYFDHWQDVREFSALVYNRNIEEDPKEVIGRWELDRKAKEAQARKVIPIRRPQNSSSAVA